MHILMVVDGGMWSDPAIYGTFSTRGQAETELVMRLPGAKPEDPTGPGRNDWRVGDDVGLILEVEEPIAKMRARVLPSMAAVPPGAVVLYEEGWNEECSVDDHVSAIRYFGTDPLNHGSPVAAAAVEAMLSEPGILAQMQGVDWFVILEVAS